MIEIWKEVEGFPEYAVSNTGFVKRIKKFENGKQQNKVGCILAFRPGGYKKKYLRVSFNKNDKGFDRYVHRLVLEHFYGPCPDGYQASHLDGNPHNNNISNLKWESPKQNSQRKILHGTSGKCEKNSMAIITQKQVIQIIDLYLSGKKIDEISSIINASSACITAIVQRRNWTSVEIGEQKEIDLKIERKRKMVTSNGRKRA